MFALVTPSPPPPIILVQQQQRSEEAPPRQVRGMRRRNRDTAFPAEEFVDAVQQHRFLFDRNEPEFKNVAMKEAMWEAIGQQFGISGKQRRRNAALNTAPLRRFPAPRRPGRFLAERWLRREINGTELAAPSRPRSAPSSKLLLRLRAGGEAAEKRASARHSTGSCVAKG
ncbi:hypothetical protein HPB49_015110 [Dermacentor silvarum]|uniref:Uncharacterized protein n=1 Tax=Dermacentor silvarum TaxID=543639 RepID=A0ACB8DPY5_DERSI|nr:hypothetical protein HPB49_015110 [Dermacentor silvarum]